MAGKLLIEHSSPKGLTTLNDHFDIITVILGAVFKKSNVLNVLFIFLTLLSRR